VARKSEELVLHSRVSEIAVMNEQLIIMTVPPPATLREQDAADLEMLLAGLKWRESAGCVGPDEFAPLSGARWHVVLGLFLSAATSTTRSREAAELEYLVKILEGTETSRPGTDRRWADTLRRFIREDYPVPAGRPKQDVRDRLLSRHYWLLRRVYPVLGEDDCAKHVAMVYADAGGLLSGSRVKRIAKTAQNSSAAQQWINEQTKAFADHEPDVVVRALLATFEPLSQDRKVMGSLFRGEVK
jgi:hypothetical protein